MTGKGDCDYCGNQLESCIVNNLGNYCSNECEKKSKETSTQRFQRLSNEYGFLEVAPYLESFDGVDKPDYFYDKNGVKFTPTLISVVGWFFVNVDEDSLMEIFQEIEKDLKK